MKSRNGNFSYWNLEQIFSVLFVLAILIAGCSKQKPATAAGTTSQSTFTTPEEAGKALQSASRANDESSLAQILGPQSKEILSSGVPVEDKAAIASFVKKYDRMNRWVAMTDGSRVLYIGADNYPFPIPLAQTSTSQWYFNTAAGKDEILARRIGKNEILAIDAISAMAHADHAGDKNVGHLGASGVLDGYTFRILTDQQDSPKSGEIRNVSVQKKERGVVVLASPVTYGDSGIMTFILSQNGIAYQKDLGKNAASAAGSIQQYNLADGWTEAE